MSGKNVIWTPDGMVGLGKAERTELSAGVGEWLRQFAEVAPKLRLWIQCRDCGNDMVGMNSDFDRSYGLSCGCRELMWPNRDYRPSGTKH